MVFRQRFADREAQADDGSDEDQRFDGNAACKAEDLHLTFLG
jgi:hypothetical protein